MAGCIMNRKRPGPERRTHMSSKKSRVNKYGSPVRTSLRIAPGSPAKRMANVSEIKIELRESDNFICWRRLEIDQNGQA